MLLVADDSSRSPRIEVTHDNERTKLVLETPAAHAEPQQAPSNGDDSVSFAPAPSVALDLIPGSRGIWWGLFFCNMATLWAYQTLITAQDVYNRKFPDADISFWGTVSYGIALVVAHVVQMVFGTDKHFSFRWRVIPGFLCTAALGGVVIIFQKPGVILFAFALTGVLNTLISGPLYGIAGLFATGAFTGAVNIGNGWAGVLTVGVETLIRVIFDVSDLSGDPEDFTMYLFTGVMIFICLVAVAVFIFFTRIPVCRDNMDKAEMQRLASAERRIAIDKERVRLVWETIQELWAPAIAQFWVFFISLGLWPGIPCAAEPHGWFADHPSWQCSPWIIGAFNLSDFVGRSMAPWFTWMSMRRCMWLSLARTLLVIPVVLCVKPQKIENTWVLVGVLFVTGWTNGLLSTLSMMKGPRIARRPEIGAYVMVLALYMGIAIGAITAAVLNRAGWPN